MYRMERQVRYSEIASNGKVTPHQIVSYFQDCSTEESELIGKGFDYCMNRKRVWVLSSWQIEVDEYPKLRDSLVVRSWATEFSGFYGYRNFDLTDAPGKQIARANSIWCLIDIDTGMPLRLEEEDARGYDLDKKLPMEPVGRKLANLKEGEEQESFKVRRADIDTNGHVNNSKYIAWAEEYLPEGFVPKKFRVQYRQQARWGQEIVPLVQEKEDVYAIGLKGADGNTYVSIEFAKEGI